MDQIYEQYDARSPRPEKKMNGVGFWMIVALAIFKDALDLPVNLTFIFSFLVFFTGLFMSFIIFFYLFYNNVGFVTKFSVKKLLTMVALPVVEMTPFLSFFPMATVSLFIFRYLENHATAKKIVEKTAAAL